MIAFYGMMLFYSFAKICAFHNVGGLKDPRLKKLEKKLSEILAKHDDKKHVAKRMRLLRDKHSG
jgi:hypothetical protein